MCTENFVRIDWVTESLKRGQAASTLFPTDHHQAVAPALRLRRAEWTPTLMSDIWKAILTAVSILTAGVVAYLLTFFMLKL